MAQVVLEALDSRLLGKHFRYPRVEVAPIDDITNAQRRTVLARQIAPPASSTRRDRPSRTKPLGDTQQAETAGLPRSAPEIRAVTLAPPDCWACSGSTLPQIMSAIRMSVRSLSLIMLKTDLGCRIIVPAGALADVAADDLFQRPWRMSRPRSARRAAAVANPARSECPAKWPSVRQRWRGSPRARSNRRRPEIAHADRSGERLTHRRRVEPAAQRGQVASSPANGTATVAPAPSRLVFERRIVSTTPSESKPRSSTSSATSSLRAQPAKRRSRSHGRHTRK
jgi:hypothetical protein